jgi:hypothetical protein
MGFQVTYLDGRGAETTAGDADIVALERQFDVSFPELQRSGALRYEHLMYLAWISLHRAGQAPTFDEWLATVKDWDPVGEDDPARPTEPGPSDEPSVP